MELQGSRFIITVRSSSLKKKFTRFFERLNIPDYHFIDCINLITAAQKLQPDLIIATGGRPGGKRFRTLEVLKYNAATAYIPIIVLVGREELNRIYQWSKLGADGILDYPVNSSNLLEMIKVQLRKRNYVNDKLEELRSAIAVSLPHEFRTPLTGLLGYSKIIYEEAGDLSETELKNIAGKISGAGNQLKNRIEKFLKYTDLVALSYGNGNNGRNSADSLFSVKASVLSSCLKVASVYKRSDDLHLDVADAALSMREEHFEMLIDELMDNAYKFSASGSPVSVSGIIENGRYKLTVTNSGCNLTTENVNEMNTLWDTLDSAAAQNSGRLGFAIVKRIVEMSGIAVSLSNNAEGDITAVCEMPLPQG